VPAEGANAEFGASNRDLSPGERARLGRAVRSNTDLQDPCRPDGENENAAEDHR
jgi:hypothetical protein